jgi:hypothetical protein
VKANLQMDRAISLLAAIDSVIGELRKVAQSFQAGRSTEARGELQLLDTQLDELIATLGEGPAAVPLDGKELIAELRLVRGDIEALRRARPAQIT